MARQRLIQQITPVYLLVVVLSTAAVAWFAGESVRQFYMSRTRAELENKANLLLPQVRPLLNGDHRERLQLICQALGPASHMRITLIDRQGVVLGDSQEDPATMENHGGRPEVIKAYGGEKSYSVRYSNTIGTDMMYQAVPIIESDQTVAVVRTAISLQAINDALLDVYWRIAFGGALLALLAGGLGLAVFSTKIVQPLKQLQQGARQFASGRLDQPVFVPDSEEIGSLAEAFNAMARQLNERMETIVQQSQERQAILAGMTEGVIAVDTEERIIAINRAATQLTGVDFETGHGRNVVEVIRNADLQQFVSQTLSSDEPTEGEIILRSGSDDVYLQASGAALRMENGSQFGAVVVLNDVTRLRQLEVVRQEFVGNVSHELKTPISAIKAAVETSLDLEEERDEPVSSHTRFLKIISRQTDRLNAIVEDLLILARLEQGAKRQQPTMAVGSIRPVVNHAVETCHAKADRKNIAMIVSVADDLSALINDQLLEQALINLLDNAIKFSPDGSEVHVIGELRDGVVLLEVVDQGSGIEQEHLPRIFERFYRTDKARSRELGGTGLGLAIVKHVAQVHGGSVSATSVTSGSAAGQESGQTGSRFSIQIPGR